MKQHSYFFYILTNPNKTVLYIGVTNDLERRLKEHLEDYMDKRKSFSGKYFCYNLIYYEWYQYIQAAIEREKEVKGWLRKKKEKLIATFNPEWRFLNDPAEIATGNLPVWHIGDEYWRPTLDNKSNLKG